METKKNKYKLSKCCNLPLSRSSDLTDVCSKCLRVISPEEYYALNRITVDMKLVTKSLKNFLYENPYKDIRTDGLTPCCNAIITLNIIDFLTCSGCLNRTYLEDKIVLKVEKEEFLTDDTIIIKQTTEEDIIL